MADTDHRDRSPAAPAKTIDDRFTALPLRRLADAALQRARELGAEHADFRVELNRAQYIRLSDANLETLVDADDVGLAVRVIKNGTWGFAGACDLTPEAATRAAADAVDIATVAAAINRERIELAELPELLAAKLAAPSVQAGTYDLVIHPSNLWLTIHESIGHATELDRALGYEAAYAGTSFATTEKLGTLRYGSPAMHVTGDRTAEHGLATVGFDDEGVAAQSWDIVSGGVFTGYQLDRRMARRGGFDRSNGCAFADSPAHMPLQRMANVSLRPAEDGPSTEELIAGVERGIYIMGDKSWSIDMQRCNFQFTGQRFYKIESGRLAGQLRDVAYQATTTDFWNSLEAVGGEQTYVLGGAFTCGKGQPCQIAPVGHGAPAVLMRGIRILNTVEEAG